MVQWESWIAKSRIHQRYTQDIQRDYEGIQKYLPQKAGAILDIGCGVGGIDIFLYQHYIDLCPSMVLLDKTQVSQPLFYGFQNLPSFYNSLTLAKDFLIQNGVPPQKIYTEEARHDEPTLFKNKFDLILSIRSWGFHYPVGTYLDGVDRALAEDGVLILDIRNETGGEDEIQKRFGAIQTIHYSKNFFRIVARKNSHVRTTNP